MVDLLSIFFWIEIEIVNKDSFASYSDSDSVERKSPSEENRIWFWHVLYFAMANESESDQK